MKMRWRAYVGLCSTLLAALANSPRAMAENAPSTAFYVGGHAGYLFGNANATLSDPTGGASAGGTTVFGSLFGGVQGGYERYFPSRLMLGIEADLSFMNYMDFNQVLSYRATQSASATEQLEFLGTLRGRVGYAFGDWTPFLTGGLAWASTRFSRTDWPTGNEDATSGQWRLGYAVGGGIDYSLDRRWSTRLEYLYTNLGLTGFLFASGARYDSQYDFHRFRVALNYRFDNSDDKALHERNEQRAPLSWEIHGQTTFIFQGYPPFNAPYDGPQSLPGGGLSRQTWTSGAFLGVRLWKGGELYYNPELLQGFGLADTTGAGGFPNGEAQKSNFPFPRYNTSRLFLRQEFGLGGEREKVESDYGQLAGEKDISRITLQVGKFAVHDLFDTNDYANDSRIDFLNWSIWASGAFDYGADRVGLTYGIAAELNRPDWAWRAGYFLMPTESNGNVMDWYLFARGEYVTELELRYKALGRPGVAKGGVFLNTSFAGSYSDAVMLANTLGVTADNTIAQTRQGRLKYGFYLNLQQELSDDVGAFGRFSWNDGKNEIMAFTDIDTSLSLGLSIKGTSWGRAGDVVGIAGALNMVSPDHRSFFAVGGLGPLVGDGILPNYRPEKILETYYALEMKKGVVLTADYQLIVDPAYNADRGPVNVFSGRVHAQF
jgi:high affinity Mn2+ porin